MNEGRLIVIVEDDPQVSKLMEIVAGRAGFRTRTITDGNDAFEFMASNDVDLAVVDLGVKGLRGDELCRRLKNDRRTSHIKVLVVSGDRDARSLAMSCGADDFLAKPFELPDFTTVIETHAANQTTS